MSVSIVLTFLIHFIFIHFILEYRTSNHIILGKSDNYRQVTQANPGNLPPNNDSLKAEYPKMLIKNF